MGLYDKLNRPEAFAVFLLTLFLPVLIGVLSRRRMKNQTDFFIGGRAMDKFVVALSAVSSGRSSWLVLGVSGMAFTRGTGAVWAVAGYITAEMLQFLFMGRKLREQTESMDSLTLLDWLETRLGDARGLIRLTGSAIILLFLTAYVAAQFNAGAKSLGTALNIPVWAALLASGALVLVYMVLGGYIAVAYNDVVRALILLAGLVIFPAYGLIEIGGVRTLLEILRGLDPGLIDPFSLGIGAIIGFLGIGLGSPGQPHIVVRYMSIDKPDRLRFAAVVGTIWNVILGWGAVFIGLLGRALVQNATRLPDGDPEMIYLVLASDFFSPVLYGLIIGGIFAAILSTADSQLLVVASTFVRDIYEKILRKGRPIDEKRKLVLSRCVVVISGLLALILAHMAQDLVFWLVLFAWGGLGASFGTSLLFALYWEKTSRAGVLTGMVTGTLVTVGWKLFLSQVTGLYELIPAFACSALAIVGVSLAAPDRTGE